MSMTNTPQNLYTEGSSENTALTNSSSDSNFVFLYKKTEKIAAALYLVTDLLDHEEPLRWSLRQNITSLLNLLVSLRDAADTRTGTKHACQNLLIDLVTQLNVAASAGLISQMNGSVLVRELNALADRINTLPLSHGSEPVLNDAFFTQPDAAVAPVDPAKGKTPRRVDPSSKPARGVGGVGEHDASDPATARPIGKGQGGVKPAVQAKKNKRQSAILHLIKDRGEVGVKDVAKIVGNCSEKTLQRELMALVREGVLQKTGKRRWTRYSFA
ncbi:MAG: hypothetical protein WD049_08730 [Candidatus Paceibacterota bacterium]